MKLETLDTTLRDGAQCAGISFTAEDKAGIIGALDSLGITYIEAGVVTNREDAAVIDQLCKCAKNAVVTAFGSTRHCGERARDDLALRCLSECRAEVVSIYGKSWIYQVEHILGCTPEENLAMIRDSIMYLRAAGKRVLFDCEHFFDGYSDSPEYALRVAECACEAGAERVILCDTNGGMLTDAVGLATEAAVARLGRICGIHAHNDLGLGVAVSVSSVLSGAVQVQGTISGIGERCGNANMTTLIPLLQLKLGFDVIDREQMRTLSSVSRKVNELANRTFDEHEPFVGGYAFTHKAGAHIDGVIKTPRSFEHIEPSAVGNERNLVISSLSGRAAIMDKLKRFLPSLTGLGKESGEIKKLLAAIKEKEARGYTYEDAEGSLSLVISGALGMSRKHFELLNLKVMTGTDAAGPNVSAALSSVAIIKISVGDETTLCAAEGNGPVNAMDNAMRKALLRFYPTIADMHLTDYRVRVISFATTASVVRVVIESSDGVGVWRTVGVSEDIIDASWQALCDSVEYYLGKQPSVERNIQ